MTDLEIAQSATLRPIADVAAELGLGADDLFSYGPHMAKVLRAPAAPRGKLILVTAITPTPAGEGKTTLSVGLTQALGHLGKRAAVAVREPSLGPVFGIKGGATGGGRSQVLPMEELNLHFTGDFHAITAANNLLAALVDNHLHQGNALGLDPRRIEIKRALDVNDRALRKVVLGLGGTADGVAREGGFELTVATEVMAIMALAEDLADLQARLGRILVGYTYDGKAVTAADLKADGSMAVLLKHALHPNLVQTLEGQPAFVHMGPFGNIAHGTNSIRATRLALGLADYVVTEAGFATDLGMEKYFDLVCRQAGFQPAAVVVLASIRALRHHGGAASYATPNPEAVKAGLANLEKHVENARLFGYDPVIALNRFTDDSPEELEILRNFARTTEVPFAVADIWAKGGAGGVELAEAVIKAADKQPAALQPLYPVESTIHEKLERIATSVYGADGVEYTKAALTAIQRAEAEGMGRTPVIVAKAAASLSDDPKLRGRPRGFKVTVTDLKQRRGAGFVVAYLGSINTLPGLPKDPAASRIHLDAEGNTRGLF
ncbi:formate--tetrahydrofolate ligase [Vulgatibacter incomptus]|uniref:Formate--tetrahydrofolate ligase n=1 Tax=Vulgatibacter incomptus TaxID=1391653 RepID=A0A0K1PHL0_9BACT|nr:formate--tetrahydrofolate ligase [Vulgatibacter incomptus]AKU92886.1 Formate--tetrahydrofolate ligase [Vulgatibacter incomptus]